MFGIRSLTVLIQMKYFCPNVSQSLSDTFFLIVLFSTMNHKICTYRIVLTTAVFDITCLFNCSSWYLLKDLRQYYSLKSVRFGPLFSLLAFFTLFHHLGCIQKIFLLFDRIEFSSHAPTIFLCSFTTPLMSVSLDSCVNSLFVLVSHLSSVLQIFSLTLFFPTFPVFLVLMFTQSILHSRNQTIGLVTVL